MWTCMLSASYTTHSSMVLVYNDPPHNQSIDQQLAPYKTIHYFFSFYYDVHSDYLKFMNFYGYYTCTDFVMHVILSSHSYCMLTSINISDYPKNPGKYESCLFICQLEDWPEYSPFPTGLVNTLVLSHYVVCCRMLIFQKESTMNEKSKSCFCWIWSKLPI